MSAHRTRTYRFETTEATHGITTWWGWECSCGAGDEGVDELFAHDLARTHLERIAPCTCGNPMIRVEGFPAVVVGACDCGYREITHFAPIGVSKHDLTALRLAKHSCRVLAGHAHHPRTRAGGT